MTESVRPTKKQRELLSFIDGFIAGHGYGPSYREIMRGLDYKSVSTVAMHIDGLVAKGQLFKRENAARSLEISRSNFAENSPVVNISVNQEKWLVDLIKQRFVALEENPQKGKRLDDLATLVAALQALGLDGAAIIAKSRLQELAKKIK